MADRHDSPIDILLAVLKEATPTNAKAKAQVLPDIPPCGVATATNPSACTAATPQPTTFVPTLALSRHRELLTRFIVATGVDLASNHEAAALLTQLHALAARIETQTRRAHDSLTGACAGLNLLLELLLALVEPHTTLNGPQAPDVLRPLLRSLSRQLADAARAIGALR